MYPHLVEMLTAHACIDVCESGFLAGVTDTDGDFFATIEEGAVFFLFDLAMSEKFQRFPRLLAVVEEFVDGLLVGSFSSELHSKLHSEFDGTVVDLEFEEFVVDTVTGFSESDHFISPSVVDETIIQSVRDGVNDFFLSNVESSSVAQHLGSPGRLLDVVVAVQAEQAADAELVEFV